MPQVPSPNSNPLISEGFSILSLIHNFEAQTWNMKLRRRPKPRGSIGESDFEDSVDHHWNERNRKQWMIAKPISFVSIYNSSIYDFQGKGLGEQQPSREFHVRFILLWIKIKTGLAASQALLFTDFCWTQAFYYKLMQISNLNWQFLCNFKAKIETFPF